MNRCWLPALCLLLAACGATQPRQITTQTIALPEKLPADRHEADKVAKNTFSTLHFHADGRGMGIAPGMIGIYKALRWTHLFDRMLRERFGLVMEGRKIIGLQEINYRDMRIGVMGCAMCHTGRAAGQTIVGLGNKRFDTLQLAKETRPIERIYVALTPANKERREVEQAALENIERIADREHGNLTQGLVPGSFILSFIYQLAGEPVPLDRHRGAVKIPALWGYGEKRYAGSFCDGAGDGSEPGWLFATELTASLKPESARRLLPEGEKAENLIAAFLPPAYQFSVSRSAASRGLRVFVQNCRECHGSYARDGDGLPRYQPPKWVPHEDIRTDSDRLDLLDPMLPGILKRGPLSDLLHFTSLGRGYFAPRLDGIWCRFPFLHNASIPNIAALLTPPAQRPMVFSLKDAGERGRFDESLLGLTLPDAGGQKRLLERGAKGDRSVYDTRRDGQSNAGHDFGTELSPADKRDLIEYLKTL